MVSGFTKSKDGEKEYSKLGIPYPANLDDEDYQKWLTETSAENLKDYTPHHEKEVSTIIRHRLGAEDDTEYLTYSYTHYRLDKALNVTHRWRPNIGIYPIPRARYSIIQGDFGKQIRNVEEVIAAETGYSIPFSKKAIDKRHRSTGRRRNKLPDSYP
jgi:hypothetical protein